jgi:D-sedoheptulose 7-phosphate isomerase
MKFTNFLTNYLNNLSASILRSDAKNIEKAILEIEKVIKRKGTIFVCGNGGSAAIANHYVCDYLKFLRQYTNYKPKIISFSNSVETITAIANDLDQKKIFSYQAESLCEKKDLVLIISSSGNSKNIIELLKFTKKKRIKTIGFSGFGGGYLKKNSDISIHIKTDNYGTAEDSHHILMHVIVQYLIFKISSKKG